MALQRRIRGMLRLDILMTLVVGCATYSTCLGTTLGQVDDFSDGTTMGWIGAAPTNVADPHPAEVGDLALRTEAYGGGGGGSRLIIYNSTQWGGDWTTAGIQRISMDLLNPSPSESLIIRLGLAGPGPPGPDNGGDSYSSLESFALPADNQWYHFTFDVSSAGWVNLGGTDINEALASVNQFRILHSTVPSINGDVIAAGFLVDNITALGPESIDGDYNDDGFVNASDYVLWRDSVGRSGADLPADGNGDMAVSFDDYEYWKSRFGNTSGSGSAMAIPEPVGLLLVGMLLLIVGMWRWFDLRRKVRQS